MSKPTTFVRVAMATVLLGAGVLKLVMSAPLIVEAMRIFEFAEHHWIRVEQATQAVGVLEIVISLLMLRFRSPKAWSLLLGATVLVFVCWDVARWVSGSAPDCGCFGGLTIATEWWHVWIKHSLLWSATAFLLLRSDRS